MTKIDIISGFLGAGKTTLIKKLISEAYKDEKIVIIENEFGEIGIDGGFLKDAGINITEMNSGCICCSLVGDFGKALSKVIDEYSPDRVIIEPSGVGKLSDVIAAVENLHSDKLILNSYTAVVDAKKCKIYHKNFGEFFNNQIESASTIILSHTKDISNEKLNVCLNIIKELNEKALIVTTEWDEISGQKLLEAIETGSESIGSIMHSDDCACGCHGHHHNHHHNEECDCHEHHHEHHHHDKECSCHGHHHEHHHHEYHDEECECGCHEHHHEHHHHDEECSCHGHHHEHHHHDADEVFISIGIQTAKKYTEAEISDILNKLSKTSKYGNILRAKGIVDSTEGKWIHFDYIPEEPEIRRGEADVTGKICVIGNEINKEAIEKLFN